MQQRAEWCKRGGEAGEQQHHGEDQPDVIRLPHGTDRFGDELAMALFARAGSQQAPHAAPEIGAAEQGVAVERDENDSGEKIGERQGTARCAVRSARLPPPRSVPSHRTGGNRVPRTAHRWVNGTPPGACKTPATPGSRGCAGSAGTTASTRSRRGSNTAA